MATPRTLSETTVATFQRVLATAEGILRRIDTLEGRMTCEEIAFLRRILDDDWSAPTPDARPSGASDAWSKDYVAPTAEPMAAAIAGELREGIRRIWEREVREIRG